MQTAKSESNLLSFNWIVDRRFDLLWFNAAALLGFLYMAVVFNFGFSALLAFWAWSLFFDRPHLISTYVRTYFDRQDRKDRGKLLFWSLLWFCLGPACVVVGILFETRLYLGLFSTFVLLYGWWHILRQHYGFFVQYQKRAGEPFGIDNRVDFYCFHSLFILPIFVVFFYGNELRHITGLDALPLSLCLTIANVARMLIVVVLLLLTVSFIIPALNGRAINASKTLYLICAASLPLYLCFSADTRVIDILTLTAAVTIFHNVQYMAFVWKYGNGKYHKLDPKSGFEQYGLAYTFTTSLLIFAMVNLCFGIGLRYFELLIIGNSSFPIMYFPLTVSNSFSSITIGHSFTVMDLAIGVSNGFVLQHYYLDQKIWRARRDFKMEIATPLPPVSTATKRELSRGCENR